MSQEKCTRDVFAILQAMSKCVNNVCIRDNASLEISFLQKLHGDPTSILGDLRF
jgi:hypothetical protein